MLNIKNNAVFIADAHENEYRKDFLKFLLLIEKKEIKTNQLILMGDIFDILIHNIKSSHNFAMPYIKILENIASSGIEVIYLEGNHDFNIKKFFKNIKVFTIKDQPIILQNYNNLIFKKICIKNDKLILLENLIFQNIKNIKLAHGDIFLCPFVSFVLKILRNNVLLSVLNFLNIICCNKLYLKILKKQKYKNLHYKIDNFDEIAKQRYIKYQSTNLVIEGHFHQGYIINSSNIKYINLPGFANNQIFFIVEFDKD